MFKFAAIQSEIGQALLEEYGLPAGNFKTFALISPKGCYTKSTAALHVVKKLDGLWPILYALVLIPKPLRNGIYNWVARNRYKIFGKRKTCFVPDADIKNRFLD